MYIETGSIGINFDQSQEYGAIYINGGNYKGVNVLGQFQDSVLSYDCEDAKPGFYSVDLYLDLVRQTINYKVREINPNDCIAGQHIGSVLIECTDCDAIIHGVIEKEDPCLVYKRGFDTSFSVDYNGLQEVINICEANNGAFLDAFNIDYDINEEGTGIVIDNRVYGNDFYADGNFDEVDGNTGNILEDNRVYGNDVFLDGSVIFYDSNV